MVKQGSGNIEVGKGPIYTGVTAIHPRGRREQPRPVWAGQFDLNGNGELTGSHWIKDAGYFLSPICITNIHAVGIAHHATVGWMLEQYRDYFREYHSWAMPVIAETYDGLVNDICGRHVTELHVLDALNSAASGALPEGSQFAVATLIQSNFGLRQELNICGAPVGKHWTAHALISETLSHEP